MAEISRFHSHISLLQSPLYTLLDMFRASNTLSFRSICNPPLLGFNKRLRPLPLRHVRLSRDDNTRVLDEDLIHVFECSPGSLRIEEKDDREVEPANDGKD